MRFTEPLALLLLLLLPVAAALGRPRRGYGFRRELAAVILRLLILACLILSLAGMELTRRADELAVVFLVDVSDSMPASARTFALDWIEQAMQAMSADDQAAVILFGGDALVERRMSPARELGAVTSIPSPDRTDLNEAVRLGLALYPPGAARRMVILSDGQANVEPGRLEATARLAEANGVQLQVVPLVPQPGPEVLVDSVETPTRLRQGERFELRLSLEASTATPVLVRVLAGGQILYEERLELDRGRQAYSLPLTAGEPGFNTYEVQVEPEQDTYYQNNALAAFAQVEGPPRVLVVAPPEGEPLSFTDETRPDEAAALVQALEDSEYIIETALPAGLPADLAQMAQYRSVILVDVPARELSQSQMETLQSYVRDLGGGLVTVGGPTSYGVGGYFRTPLEETLPVEMQIKDQERRPELTMVFVIDHSGSMTDMSGGATKLDLAKEAAIRSVELLYPDDRVGVVAFDDSASWVVPLTEVGDPAAIQNAIGTIRAGGGTDILAGLQAVARALPQDPSNLKHIILLTDGGADPTGIPGLVQQMRAQGITLTTVGVGRDAAPFLPELAAQGGGRYHFTADPSAIPRIFTEETTLATRAYLVEQTFVPQQASASPILGGINAVPPLHGYVGTSIKEAAQNVLVSDLNDPILATWQYGLGRAVAFTSDASGRWAQDWVQWEGFPVFWAQVVGYALRPELGSPLEVRVEAGDGQSEAAQLVVEARTEAGGYLNGYELQANLVAPDGQVEAVTLQQVAPGRYQADFTPTQPGAYLIGVAGQPQAEDGGPGVQETTGWVYAYPAEYRSLEANPDLLRRMAELTGGGVAPQPAAAFEHNLQGRSTARPAWPWLLTLAALLLPVDIAVRRLVFTPADLRRGLEQALGRVRSRVRPEAEAASPAAPRSPRLDALWQAKQRTGVGRGEQEAAEGSGRAPSNAPEAPPRAPGVEATRRRSGQAQRAPDRAAEKPSGTAESGKTTAASLLDAKRRRRQERED